MVRKFAQLQEQYLAGAGASIGNTTVILKSLKQIDGTDITDMSAVFGTKAYGTIEPGKGNREEQISFTGITSNADGTVSLTGVSSVLMTSPYTETAGLTKQHAGGVVFVISNTSAFYSEFIVAGDDYEIDGEFTFKTQPKIDIDVDLNGHPDDPVAEEDIPTKYYVDKKKQEATDYADDNFVPIEDDFIINGQKTFTESPIVPDATDDGQVVNLSQLQEAIFNGALPATESQLGLVRKATQEQFDDGQDNANDEVGKPLYVSPSQVQGLSSFATAGEDIGSAGLMTKIGDDKLFNSPISGTSYIDGTAGTITYPITWASGGSFTSSLYGYSMTIQDQMARLNKVSFKIFHLGGSSGGTNTRSITLNIYNTDVAGFKTGASLGTVTVSFNGYFPSETRDIEAILGTEIDTSVLTYGKAYIEFQYTTTDSDDIRLEEVPTLYYKLYKGRLYLASSNDKYTSHSTSIANKGEVVRFSNSQTISFLSGITTGQAYYMDDDGAIATTGDNFIGYGINSNQINAKRGLSAQELINTGTGDFDLLFITDTDGFCYGEADSYGSSVTLALNGITMGVARDDSSGTNNLMSWCIPVTAGDILTLVSNNGYGSIYFKKLI